MNFKGWWMKKTEGEEGWTGAVFSIVKDECPGMHEVEGNMFHRKMDDDFICINVKDTHKPGHTIKIPIIILGFEWMSATPPVSHFFKDCEIGGVVYKTTPVTNFNPVWDMLNADKSRDIYFTAKYNLQTREGKIALTYMPIIQA